MEQQRIYNYFARNPKLHVLFIFDKLDIIENELRDLTWEDNYVYKVFDGAWFNTKYAIEHTWKEKNIVLLFPKNSYPHTEAELLQFPLLDMLKANLEYKVDDYASFLQQYGLPQKFSSFVQRNITELRSSKLTSILSGYLQANTFTEDVACRAFISSYLGDKKLVEWDTIIVKMMILDIESEKRCTDFYHRLSKNNDATKAINHKLTQVFGLSFNPNTVIKMSEIASILKYNSITQLLSVTSADNYKKYKITSPTLLDQINKIYERGTQERQFAENFDKAINTLASCIKEEEIIATYGIDADYFHMTEKLCWPILNELLSDTLIADPAKVNDTIRELTLKLPMHADIQVVLRFVEQTALYYNKVRDLGTLKLNSAQAYIQKYMDEFYLVDRYYRKALEEYHKLVGHENPIEHSLNKAKKHLDLEYARVANEFNLEWLTCVTERQEGFEGIVLKRQEDFYKNEADASVKQVFIITDALRYELATELMDELAKEKHIAKLSACLAMLPTETKYCKPALLPHRTLELQGTDMLVDGNVLAGIPERSAHLARYKQNAACINFDDVMNGTQASNREFFKRPLVYIFHNTIDEASHSQSPFELTNACKRAVEQLATLVKRLHATWNVNNVILTSDHGFIYNDIKIAEKDKHVVKEECIEKKTRYYLTHNIDTKEGIVKFPLQAVSGIKTTTPTFVAVPLGTNRMAAPGGYNFAHGGATLQELIIPVIHSNLRKEEKTEKVNVALMTHNLNLVSSQLKFQVIQSEAVSMHVQERTILCTIYNGDTPVTDSKTIYLNSTDTTNLNNRVYEVTLKLNQSVSATMLQLRIYDEKDLLNPLIKETVKNSTIIEQDF